MSNDPQNLKSLFQGAQQEGTITAAAAAVLDIPDLGAQIQQGLGVSVDDVDASEVTLVSLLIDDSGSIRFVKGNTEAVRDGHNGIIDALGKAKKKDGILLHTRYLNDPIPLNPYRLIDNATRMDSGNYDPKGGTPLHDQTIVLLGSVLAKSQEFSQNGIPCRCVTAILTDGADQGSRKGAKDVAKLVNDLLRTEQHIIIGMGIDDGQTDFRAVFKEMGIPEEFILVANADPKDIRAKCMLVSQTAVRASQGAAGFSQAAMGGFNTP